MGEIICKTSPSRGRSPTLGADIISYAFPGRPLGFQQLFENGNTTNEQTTRQRFKLHVLHVHFLVRFMLL
jgi:hypothetical protein